GRGSGDARAGRPRAGARDHPPADRAARRLGQRGERRPRAWVDVHHHVAGDPGRRALARDELIDERGDLTQGKHILLVEDDDGVREALAVFLQSEGYGVVEAEHGEAALRRLHTTTTFCLILL